MGPTFALAINDIAIGVNATDTTANLISVFELPAATNQSLRVTTVDLTFDGTTATNKPVLVQLAKATATGTFPSSNLAPAPENNDSAADTTVVTAANVKWGTATGEGTMASGNGYRLYRLPPTSGVLYQLPLGRELWVPKATFFRIRIVGTSAVNVTFNVAWEE